ncbi:hypothetical protein RFI_15928 [Reticulomyxa filosa]|uniref:VWFA domain-containing protein n=1 Tax=Reticulomyxa filosa TaxID=46433 RepID=X6N4Q6_RETFI|nr:hypothetical protein RFI_15928 [Reticulomyxa filosa]|eukprot:ETO21275.1 hypothetical protein RFI_15928 [Reticulomyxa filosa]
MDATGSMSHLLQKAKNAVCTMFERIATILKGHGLSSNSFEIQFVVYRNYNAPEDILLQVSPWESKPDKLRSFMETVKPCYGIDSEAVEVGLAHVNRERAKDGVSQVILIGDAPANAKNDVIAWRQSSYRGTESSGAEYWRKTKLFSSPTYYEEELTILKQYNIPVHAFYVERQAKENFEAIARISGGRCAELKINSDEGSDQLTNVVSEEVLRNAGGSKGSALVDAYRAKFSKAHV